MSNVYSLDDMKRDIEKEFAPVQIEIGGQTVTLQNLMRVDAKKRDAIMEALTAVEKARGDDAEGVNADQIGVLANAVETLLFNVADKGDLLVKSVAGDLALSLKIMNLWMEASQPGEASSSPS